METDEVNRQPYLESHCHQGSNHAHAGLKEERKNPPAWLELDVDNLSAKVVRMPSKEDIDIPVEEQMIVELYSK